MAVQEFTLPELTAVLRDAAGEVEGLDGDILDLSFEELGYDSLALMEAGARIERDRGLQLEESALLDARTPRGLLLVINDHLSAVGTA